VPAGGACGAACLPGFDSYDGMLEFECSDTGSGFAWKQTAEGLRCSGEAGMQSDRKSQHSVNSVSRVHH
jgi:hypothetical protein